VKASLEYFVLLFLGSFVLVFMIQFTGLIYKVHQGHQFLDYIIHLINNYDGQMDLVEKKLEENRICMACDYRINYLDNQYEVEVSLPFAISAIGIDEEILMRGLSLRL